MTTQRTWRWLALFLVVDVVLVVVMLRHVSGDTEAETGTSAPIEESTAPPADTVAASAPAGLIEATGDTVVWGPRGSCADGGPIVLGRVTGDARDDLEPGITELLRLDLNEAGDVYVIGADASCQPVELLLADGSDEWVDPSGPIRRWHLTAGAPTLTTPAGQVDPGCQPVSFVADDAEGVVGCADGGIRTSDDDGATWEGDAVLAGLRSLVPDGDGVVALAPAEECAVEAHRIIGSAITRIGCVTAEPVDGLVLLAQSGDGYVAVVGDTVLRSDDGNAWEPLGG